MSAPAGIILYGSLLFASMITIITYSNPTFIKSVYCENINSTVYIYESNFLFTHTHVKIRRGNSIFIHKVFQKEGSAEGIDLEICQNGSVMIKSQLAPTSSP